MVSYEVSKLPLPEMTLLEDLGMRAVTHPIPPTCQQAHIDRRPSLHSHLWYTSRPSSHHRRR